MERRKRTVHDPEKRPHLKLALFFVSLVFTALLPGSANAQVFRVASGEVIEGDIVDESPGFYVIKLKDGRKTVLLKSELDAEPIDGLGKIEVIEAAEPEAVADSDVREPVSAASLPLEKRAATKKEKYAWFSGQRGYAKALEIQQVTRKPYLIYFYTDWCPSCRNFAANVFRLPQVRKALGGALKVQVNGDLKEKVMTEFGVRGYPTIYIVPASGQPVSVSSGTSAADFLRLCRQIDLID